jgi:hypothetical protein
VHAMFLRRNATHPLILGAVAGAWILQIFGPQVGAMNGMRPLLSVYRVPTREACEQLRDTVMDVDPDVYVPHCLIDDGTRPVSTDLTRGIR